MCLVVESKPSAHIYREREIQPRLHYHTNTIAVGPSNTSKLFAMNGDKFIEVNETKYIDTKHLYIFKT